jgi:DNA modification methylase
MFTETKLQEIKRKVERKNEKYFQQRLFPTLNISKISNDFEETLIRVDGEIPVDLPVKNGDRFLFISYDQTRFTHGIHKYPAKFFPELPRWLIKKYSNEYDIVLDPFGGSATTSVEALLNKRHSVSIDVDPFAIFLARVKTTKLDNMDLDIYSNLLIKKITEFKITDGLNDFIPDFPYRDNWFKKEIIYELAYIKKSIFELNISEELRNFFLATFSSIIRNVSNADDHCTRTVVRKKLKKQIFPSMALTKFVENLLLYVSRIKEFNSLVPPDVRVEIPVDSDARDIKYGDDYFDFAVTSPPYVNAVDYPRTHQLEMYWLGLAQGSLTPIKKKHVGTESVTSSDYSELHKINVREADKVLENIFEKDKRRSFIAYKFLADMEKNLIEVYRTLKTGSKYAIVIGNNQIRGERFESWKYLIPLAERNGFKLKEYFGSEIIKHFIKIKRDERINTDWIIVFEK